VSLLQPVSEPQLNGIAEIRVAETQGARERMAPAIERYAAEAGRRCTALSFRDTRSRWGSCSSAGRISLSWRLAMAPPVVQDYVAAHEVAHLVEMNHSPRYWAVLARLMPDYEIHRRWLRREGRALHAYDFSA
ncbi:MAG: YgjP-like metallopeptidase domain-containing protein, partial [Pseudomonadota bacterium]